MKIVYKLIGSIGLSWLHKLVDENVYELQQDEVFGDEFQKPVRDADSTIIYEGWTTADDEALILANEMLSVAELLDKFQDDGIAFYLEVRNLVKWHYDKGNITTVQFKAIRNVLEPALRPLKLGDWDIAQDLVNDIPRPSGALGQLYDFVKNKIDNYLS